MKAELGGMEILPGEDRWGAQGIPASSGKGTVGKELPFAAPPVFSLLVHFHPASPMEAAEQEMGP